MKRLLTLVIVPALLRVHANSEDVAETVLLERGRPGIVPCPLIRSQPYRPENIDGMYWYLGGLQRESLLISSWLGVVAPQNGIPEGVYDINRNFSLIIENVTDSDEGNYFFRVKAKQETERNGNVRVAVKVSPREPFPVIGGCDPLGLPSDPDECEVLIPYGTPEHNLTCEVHYARPAAVVEWLRVLEDGRMERLDSTTTVQHVLLGNISNTAWPSTNNTYTTSASLLLSSANYSTRYTCRAYGVALGDKNGSQITATVTVASPPVDTVGADTTIIKTTTLSDEATAAASDVPKGQDGASILLGVLIAVFAILIVVVILVAAGVITVYIRKRRGRYAGGNRSRHTSETSRGDPENGPESIRLLSSGVMDLSACQRALKDFFLAKMQAISIDLSSEHATDAMHTDTIFVDLKLHEKDKTINIESREEIIKLFRRDRKRIVLKGMAGCGKTTLVKRFAFDWGDGIEYLSRFDLVFVLKMEEMTDCVGLLDAIICQNFPKDRSISKDRLRSIISDVSEAGRDILLILDGLDEIKPAVLDKMETTEDEISVKDVLAVNSLVESYVIVTTRPHMMKTLFDYNENQLYTVIETLGLTEENRDVYIRSRFAAEPAKATGLIREIETASFLEVLATQPIMLMLLCYIYEKKARVPARITELYGRAVDVLMTHRAKKAKASSRRRKRRRIVWKEKQLEQLGQVAFEDLMGQEGEKRVSEKILKEGYELGLLSEEMNSRSRKVIFSHQTFKEYFAACYLAKQPESFIRERLLPKVTIDTIEEFQYLLRFVCGMSERAASVIFDHVCGIKDSLISDRYLRVQHLTLMLYYEAKSDRLRAGVGSRLSLKYKEEFEALHYYVEKISKSSGHGSSKDKWSALQPKLHLERLEVYMHVTTDQSKVRNILQHVDADNLYFGLLLSDTLKSELQQLDDTISGLLHRPARLIVCIDKRVSHSTTEAESAGVQDETRDLVEWLEKLCPGESQVCPGESQVCPGESQVCQGESQVCPGESQDYQVFQGKVGNEFGVRIECDIIKTPDTLTAIVANLADIEAVYFGVLNNNLSGEYLQCLSPLIPHLKYIELYDCKLTGEDLKSLAELLPKAQRLRELYISGGRFSEGAVDSLMSQLRQCPRMLVLELNDTGLEQEVIQSVVQKHFKEMTPVDGNCKGQFWLKRKPLKQES